MRNAARLVTLTVCFALAGCPDRNPPVDGGTDTGRDAPSIDVRADVPIPSDTGPTDGGGDDGGMSDGGEDDAGGGDAGEPFCGDGVTNGDEDCDLSDLGLDTCMTEGFNTGTLDCATDCTFDTTGCRNFACGDGMVEGTEACDGTELGKNTCGSAGFDGGTLSCTACTLDTSACTDCGDGTIEGTEVCDGTSLGGATCASQGFLSGTLACGATCAAFDTSGCAAAPAPTAGQIVITEIMPNPRALNDGDGEWFEVRNTTAGPLQLEGCVFLDNQATPAMFTLTGSLIIPANGYLTFAIAATPGFTPDYVYPSSWNLAQGGDEVRLNCGGALIDSVIYTSGWPFANGASMSLDPGSTTAAANDMQANWCLGTGVYNTVGANTDEGTPGTANPACGVVIPPEVCTGGADEDGDTFIDCLDSDCAADPACVVTPPPALLFSEYVEGSSNNKALELLNTGTTPIDLAAAGCSLRVYTTAAGVSVVLTGTIAPGDVFVVCNTSASFAATCDQTSGNMSFNGDDAIVLTCGTTVVDSFGQQGVDPGAEWGTGLTSTADNTLRRLCTRTADTTPADAFDPSVSWSGFATDTFDGLGSPACVTP